MFKERLNQCSQSRASRESMAEEGIKGSRSSTTRALVNHYQKLAECDGEPPKVFKMDNIT